MLLDTATLDANAYDRAALLKGGGLAGALRAPGNVFRLPAAIVVAAGG